MKKTPLKRKNNLKGGNGLKKSGKIKPRKKTEEDKKVQQEQFERDKEFYLRIWEERPHYCESCDKWLGNEPNLCFFDHLITKSSRNDLRYEPGNIGLVCHSCHANRTNGFPSERHQILINKTKERFL